MYVSIGYPPGQGATLIADTGAGKLKLGVLPAWKTGIGVTLQLNNCEKANLNVKFSVTPWWSPKLRAAAMLSSLSVEL